MFKRTAFAALALLTTVAVAKSGFASGFRKTGCTVSGFEYDSGRIILTCSGDATTYYGFASGTCAVGTDTIKVWTSMLQSQLLAGRKIEMWVNDAATCAGNNVIGSVKMLP